MRLVTTLFLLAVLIATGCAPAAYQAENFEQRTAGHQTIAVLPLQLTYTGRLPTDWSEAKADSLRRQESLLLQTSLQTALLNRVRNSRRTFRVDLLATTTTNNRLRAAGIEPHLAYLEDPAVLVATLGVDAIVVTAVNKERFLSEEASFVVSTANTVISTIGNNPVAGILGRGARTYNVDVRVDLVDAEGVVLFNDRSEFNMDWATTPNESIEIIGARISRRFPY